MIVETVSSVIRNSESSFINGDIDDGEYQDHEYQRESYELSPLEEKSTISDIRECQTSPSLYENQNNSSINQKTHIGSLCDNNTSLIKVINQNCYNVLFLRLFSIISLKI